MVELLRSVLRQFGELCGGIGKTVESRREHRLWVSAIHGQPHGCMRHEIVRRPGWYFVRTRIRVIDMLRQKTVDSYNGMATPVALCRRE
jgi:hypothetical protein